MTSQSSNSIKKEKITLQITDVFKRTFLNVGSAALPSFTESSPNPELQDRAQLTNLGDEGSKQ